MIKFLNKILKKNDYKKFLLLQRKIPRKIKDHFDEEIIYMEKSYRSYKDDAFRHIKKDHNII